MNSRTLFFIAILSLSPNLFAANWPARTIKNYQNAKTLQAWMCEGQVLRTHPEACKYYRAKIGDKMREKPPRLVKANSTTLRLELKSTSITLRRGKSHSEFLVNGHSLQVNRISSFTELQSKLRKAMPKTASFGLSLIPEAYAAEGDAPVDPRLEGIIGGLITDAAKLDSCEAVNTYVDTCTSATGDVFGETQRIDQLDKENLPKEKMTALADSIAAVLPKLQESVKVFDEVVLPYVKNAQCPVDVIPAYDRVVMCRDVLQLCKTFMGMNYEKIDNQLSSDVLEGILNLGRDAADGASEGGGEPATEPPR